MQISTDTQTTDNRRARSEATKNAIMRAAEKLIAQEGVENVSIREIVAAAEQKNESALQYHFKNLSGLLHAIHHERSEQVQLKRGVLLDELRTTTPTPTLRQLCTLMVEPTFLLARASIEFRHYVKAFGHELAVSDVSPLKIVSQNGGGGQSGQQITLLLKAALEHLDEEVYRRRMEAAVVLCSTSMYHQAKQKNAFRGQQSDWFLHNLIDALVGLLSAPVSPQTKALQANET